MEPEALLFDLDGTLVDGAGAIQDAFAHSVRERGYATIPEASIASRIGMPLRLMFRDLLSVDDRESAELVRVYRERFEKMAPTLVRPARGLHAALDAFAHVPMAVVTTKAVEPARLVLRALKIEERFGAVVGVDTVRRPKPDPEGARVALARLGVGSVRAVFVGDTIMDVLAGRGCGARTVAVLGGHGAEDELRAAAPDVVISDLSELAGAVRSI